MASTRTNSFETRSASKSLNPFSRRNNCTRSISTATDATVRFSTSLSSSAGASRNERMSSCLACSFAILHAISSNSRASSTARSSKASLNPRSSSSSPTTSSPSLSPRADDLARGTVHSARFGTPERDGVDDDVDVARDVAHRDIIALVVIIVVAARARRRRRRRATGRARQRVKSKVDAPR